MTSIRLGLSCLLSLIVNSSYAALLLDWSPDTIQAEVGCCVAQGNNGLMFLQQVNLTQAATLNGFVYYNENNGHNPNVGDHISFFITQGPLTLNQRPPSPTNPSDLNLTGTVTSNSFEGATAGNYGNTYGYTGIYADIPSIQLAAGTYWIGYVASTGFALLHGTNASSNAALPHLSFPSLLYGGFDSSPPEGTMSIRLYGDVASPIPAPATAVLLVSGLVGLAILSRRKTGKGSEGDWNPRKPPKTPCNASPILRLGQVAYILTER